MSTLRYALRALANAPGFAAAAVLCLALGIGANTAIFTVVNAVLFRPLPFQESERLVRVYSEFPSYGSSGGFRKFWVSVPELLDLRRDMTVWESLEGYVLGGVNLSGGGEPVRVTAANVTGGMLPMLGVAPRMGRLLTAADERFGQPLVVVLSEGLWRRAFGGDPGIVGREVKINGLTANVAGVMPGSFAFPPAEADPPELWVPLQINLGSPGSRSSHFLSVVGKLKAGETIERARGELQRIMVRQGADKTPNTHNFDPTFHTLIALPYHGEIVGAVRPAMLVMLGAVGFVLLIACVNVGNLLLARAQSRHHEIAVRKAIGATVWDLLKQCLAEGLLLAALGAAAGLVTAYGALRLILYFGADSIPRAAEVAIDGRVLLFTLAASLITGILFGLAPLAQFAGETQESLKSATGRTTSNSQAHWMRRAMVVSELALALMLLVGAGLMVRTFWKLQQVNVGLDPTGVITLRLNAPQGQYARTEDVTALWTRLLERARAVPGVEAATLLSGLPPQRPLNANDVKIEGYVKTEGGPDQNVDFFQAVAPGYFETMRIPLIEGRLLDERDGAGAPKAIVINQTMARMFFPNGALGRRLIDPDGAARTIVGVVADVKNAGVDKPAGTELYYTYQQPAANTRGMYLALKMNRDPGPILAAVRREIATLDPNLPVSQVEPLTAAIERTTSRPRFLTVLLALFSLVAVALAAVGIYGVMAYAVAQRTREFGIRMAIGAERGDVLQLVLGQGVRLGLIGVLLGATGAAALAGFLKQLLFQVEPFDPATFGVTALLLLGVILAACYFPARRATLVDPTVALRYE
jgi:predicted permease